MRCMMCGTEMTLIRVVEDETFMLVSGFERHAYMCSRCGDIERRFVFNKHTKERDTEAAPGLTSPPPVALSSTIKNQRQPTQSFLKRVLNKIRGQ